MYLPKRFIHPIGIGLTFIVLKVSRAERRHFSNKRVRYEVGVIRSCFWFIAVPTKCLIHPSGYRALRSR